MLQRRFARSPALDVRGPLPRVSVHPRGGRTDEEGWLMRWLVAALLVAAFLPLRGELSKGPAQDFRNHREWGRRLLADEPLYQGGLNLPYPPAWAAAQLPLSRLPLQAAFAIHVAMSVLALAGMLVLIR